MFFNDVRYWLEAGNVIPGAHGIDIPMLDMAPHVSGNSDQKVMDYMTKNPSVTAEVTIIPRK